MAVGAAPGHVLRIVFASTLGSVGAGLAIGLALSLGLNSVLAQWAKGNSRDPLILLAGALILSGFSPGEIDDVAGAFQATPQETLTEGEWTAMVIASSQKPAASSRITNL